MYLRKSTYAVLVSAYRMHHVYPEISFRTIRRVRGWDHSVQLGVMTRRLELGSIFGKDLIVWWKKKLDPEVVCEERSHPVQHVTVIVKSVGRRGVGGFSHLEEMALNSLADQH